MKKIAIDVREFAVPSPRMGSIEPGSGYKFNGITTLGQEIHKTIQAQRKGVHGNYRAEVKISHKFFVDDYCITVSGRIDGLFEPANSSATIIDDSNTSSSTNSSSSSNTNSSIKQNSDTEAVVETDFDSHSKIATQPPFTPAVPSNEQLVEQRNTESNTDTKTQSFPSSPLLREAPALLTSAQQQKTYSVAGESECDSVAGAPSPAMQIIERQWDKEAAELEKVAPKQLTLLGFAQNETAKTDESGGRSAERPHIEEIKSAFDAEKLARRLRTDPHHPYCLQAKLYAYLYWKQSGILPSASLHVVSMLGGGKADVNLPWEIAELESWIDARLRQLILDVAQQEADYKRRQELAKELFLPFERARPGQEELISQIETGIKKGKPILVQAPTGLGKTIAAMLPSLKNALERGQKLIYTTPKNSIHLVAEDAVARLREKNAKVKSLTLTAKSKLCMLEEQICDPSVCEFARDYYSKLAEHDLITKASSKEEMTPALFKEMAEEYKVCPFELSIDCIDKADVVICDYNHVFAPISLSGRLTAPTHKKNEKPNIVIDEAHNLHTRATGYFSGYLSTSDLVSVRKELFVISTKLASLADDLEGLLRKTVSGLIEKQGKVELPALDFAEINSKVSNAVFNLLERNVDPASMRPAMQFWRLCSDFCSVLQKEDFEQFQTYKRDGQHVSVKITCCDASSELRKQYGQFENVLAFSATLKPFDYYSKLSGFDDESTQVLEASCPFPRDNRKVLVIPQVSTKYRDRAANLKKICDAINRIVSLRRANYILFFPSFEYLEQVLAAVAIPENFKVLEQRRGMTRQEVSAVLEEMRVSRGCLLFAVQGGIFSEGVDFPGDMASGAIIIGPGIPAYDLERELLREYYERTYGSGFEYAYTYPAMTKVVQSAGRVVRSETDRGLIVMLDRRFLEDAYANSMPQDWFAESVNELVSTSILNDINTFWQEAAIEAV